MKDSSAGIKKILVVEDEPVITQICWRTLTGEGFEVDIAANGKVAQGMLGEKDYSLILIDIRTPLVNGKQLYQFITEGYPGLVNRLIFTSGDVVSGDNKSFLERTSRPLLPKPFTPDELKKTVIETLRQIEK